MDWSKMILPLAETGLKLYMSGKMVQKSAENAKEMAIRSSVLVAGFVAAFIAFMASVLMVFIDLGNQFETHDGVHFSGMMLSALYLTTFGLILLAISYGIAKMMEKRDREKTPAPPAIEKHPYASLIMFGEEFLKTLIQTLATNHAQKADAEASRHREHAPDHHDGHQERPRRD